jgi:hypothetical protein
MSWSLSGVLLALEASKPYQLRILAYRTGSCVEGTLRIEFDLEVGKSRRMLEVMKRQSGIHKMHLEKVFGSGIERAALEKCVGTLGRLRNELKVSCGHPQSYWKKLKHPLPSASARVKQRKMQHGARGLRVFSLASCLWRVSMATVWQDQ